MSTDSTESPQPDPKQELILPVTIGRVEKIFKEQGVNYTVDDGRINTGFPNMLLQIYLHSDQLIMSSMWRGSVPRERSAELMKAVTEWNLPHIHPVFHIAAARGADTDALGVYSHRVLPALPQAGGYTHNQLGIYVVNTLQQLSKGLSFIEERFPELVTWKEA